jgi:hypothetical protein
MEIEKLLLKKEEIPVLYENLFQMPIHPKLLSNDVRIDENLANKVFPQAAREWYDDLKEYSKTLEDAGTKEWINDVFLKKRPKIKKEFHYQYIGGWRDEVFTAENGFANSLSISRNAGGTLYFNKEEREMFVSFDRTNQYILFEKEKILEYGHKTMKLDNNIEGSRIYVYNMHNIDNYPGALFLRNWAILYLNEAMKQVFKK